MSSPDSASSTLYCAEDAADLDDGAWNYLHAVPSTDDADASDAAIADLIASEARHAPCPDYLTRLRHGSADAVTARQDSVSWILKAHAFHRFCPVTAFLAVIYFDRFLSSHSLPNPSGWPFQLLSVACLSLAAKMEEPRVPLLLDLQACDPKYLFEPKTVQRMELRVMASLDWRLRAVTPFDFLHYFASKLPSSSSASSLSLIFSASSDLILSTTRVTDFLGFTPSTIAAGAIFCAMREISDDDGDDRSEARLHREGDTTSFHESVNKEMVRSCHQLMEEYLMDTCPARRHKARRRAEPAAPPSPVGVLDAAVACGSCDTRSEPPPPSDPAEPLPSSKRLRSSAPDVQQR